MAAMMDGIEEAFGHSELLDRIEHATSLHTSFDSCAKRYYYALLGD
jgi:hypothetical protein